MKNLHVIWSHGKESGPWGTKISELVKVSRDMGFETESLDYRGMEDPDERVDKLVAHAENLNKPLVLAGSSMGGYVAAAAAGKLKALGLFLLAPAVGVPGFGSTIELPQNCKTAIVHGWRDDIIPVEFSITFAADNLAALHILDGDHRLKENIPELKILLSSFLNTLVSNIH